MSFLFYLEQVIFLIVKYIMYKSCDYSISFDEKKKNTWKDILSKTLSLGIKLA